MVCQMRNQRHFLLLYSKRPHILEILLSNYLYFKKNAFLIRHIICELSDCQMSNYTAISWREQITFNEMMMSASYQNTTRLVDVYSDSSDKHHSAYMCACRSTRAYSGADPGGGAHPARTPPPKIGKKYDFLA